jgi:D-aspartate ligase
MNVFSNKRPGVIIIGGHVQGLEIVRSLGRNNIPIIVIDEKTCIARYSKYCDLFKKCPSFLSEELISFLKELKTKYRLENWALFPTNDFISFNLATHRAQISQFYKLITPSLSKYLQFYNKHNTIQLAKKAKLSYPETWIPNTPGMKGFSIPFPVIVRGAEGLRFYKTFGKKVFIANDVDELKQILNKAAQNMADQDIMVQEFIKYDPNNKGLYYTSFAINGEVKTSFIWEKIREHPLRHGTSTCCKSIENQTIEKIGKAFISSSGYTGVSEIEFLFDPTENTFKIIEVNARTFLQLSLARACGIDYPMMMYNFIHGIQQHYPQKYTSGITWVHFWTDLFFGTLGVVKREHSLKSLIKTYTQKNTWAVLSKKDIKPFIFETLMLPYLAAVR